MSKIKKGSWVCREDNRELGRVSEVFADEDGTYLNIVLYTPKGERIGRSSPAEGGPTSFEPACPAEDWVLIESPRFPLSVDLYGHVLRSGLRLGIG